MRLAVETATVNGGLQYRSPTQERGGRAPGANGQSQWHIAYDVNVVGTALWIKHASRVMRDRGAGAVGAISSESAARE